MTMGFGGLTRIGRSYIDTTPDKEPEIVTVAPVSIIRWVRNLLYQGSGQSGEALWILKAY